MPELDPDSLQVHRVEEGDSLSGIAVRYDVPGGTDTLARINDLSDPDLIRAGTGIFVPAAPGTPGLSEYRPRAYGAPPRPTCRGSLAPEPVSADAGTCEEGACTTSDGLRFCRCAADLPAGAEVRIVDASGVGLHRWGSSMHVASLDGFWVVRADLDGDASAEWILTTHDGTSNGIALSYYRVSILDGADPAAPPLTFSANDAPSTAELVAREGGCDLLTRWHRHTTDQLRGEALYEIVRRVRYDRGALTVSPDSPMWGRRVSRRFYETWETEPPLSNTRFVEHRLGVIEAATRHDVGVDPPHVDLRIRERGGETRAWVSHGVGADDFEGRQFDRLGDGSTERLLPPDYMPAHAEDLIGRAVRVALHRNTPTAEYVPWTVVWLDPSAGAGTEDEGLDAVDPHQVHHVADEERIAGSPTGVDR